MKANKIYAGVIVGIVLLASSPFILGLIFAPTDCTVRTLFKEFHIVPILTIIFCITCFAIRINISRIGHPLCVFEWIDCEWLIARGWSVRSRAAQIVRV